MNSKQKWTVFILCAFLVLLIFGLNALNHWISSQVDVVSPEVAVENKEFLESGAKKEVIRLEDKELLLKQYLDPSRKYSVNKIYADDIKIAQFKSDGDVIFELEGDIPDGKMNFKNQTQNTYGYEYFAGNQRHGDYREYYSSGEIKFEKRYSYGKLMSMKQYYIDGKICNTADYSDALLASEDSEVGEGKMYYRDGVLQYEWCLTNSSSERFKKSYNNKGRLVQKKVYNDLGELVETIDYPLTDN